MIKRSITILILIVFLATFSRAGSIGITPAYYREHFEPNLEKDFEFTVRISNPEGSIQIKKEGPLSEYLHLNKTIVKSGEKFKAHLKLPSSVKTPGTNKIVLRISEFVNISEGGKIGTQVEILAPISIKVPYPGLYIESQFEINDQNQEEQASYKLNIQNLGTQDTNVRPRIQIHKESPQGEVVLSESLPEITMETKKEIEITNKLPSENLSAGNYYASVALDYGPEGRVQFLNDTFKVGQFLVDIIDYSYEFLENSIRPFNITVENKWNSKIPSIYADVTITDEGEVIRTFKTISVDTEPWEIKDITGYFDTTNISTGRYLANIKLYYEESMNHKLVAVYVIEEPKEKDYKLEIIVGSVIGALIIIFLIIYMIVKIHKLKVALSSKRKNEETKEIKENK